MYVRNEHLVLKYTHVYNIKHTVPENLQKKGVRWDLHQMSKIIPAIKCCATFL